MSIIEYNSERINYGKSTEWSATWSEIKRVITKSHDREAGVRFVIRNLISDRNCTTWSAITTLLYSFWNLNFKQFSTTETVLCLRKTPSDIPPQCCSVATSEQLELSLINLEKFYQKNEEILDKWIIWAVIVLFLDNQISQIGLISKWIW